MLCCVFLFCLALVFCNAAVLYFKNKSRKVNLRKQLDLASTAISMVLYSCMAYFMIDMYGLSMTKAFVISLLLLALILLVTTRVVKLIS